MTYVLTWRQIELFTDTCDLYQPTVTSGSGSLSAHSQFPANPTYAGVLFFLEETPEVDIPKPEGENKEWNIFTLDIGHFHQAQPVAMGWALHLTSSSNPDVGDWWIVQGNSQAVPSQGIRDAATRFVMLKRAPVKPAGIT